MASAPLRWRRLSVPKRGHRPEEYEDAAAGDGGLGRFAVADGATESAFAGDWSRLLAEAFVRDSIMERGWPEWLPPVRKQWLETVGNRELPWYLEEKFAQGAFSTLLGVELMPAASGEGWEWRAVAVGDCCLFQVRGNELICSFPIDAASDFNSTPTLIGSRPNEMPRDHRAKGRARHGDTFLLLSDALAQWAMRRHEARRPPWPELHAILRNPDADAAFAVWVESMWAGKELKTDDVTVLAIEMPAAEGRV
jgi:hypothetical protein